MRPPLYVARFARHRARERGLGHEVMIGWCRAVRAAREGAGLMTCAADTGFRQGPAIYEEGPEGSLTPAGDAREPVIVSAAPQVPRVIAAALVALLRFTGDGYRPSSAE